ncbi:hypothetical protein ACJX0J_038963, partial [Zea mays]
FNKKKMGMLYKDKLHDQPFDVGKFGATDGAMAFRAKILDDQVGKNLSDGPLVSVFASLMTLLLATAPVIIYYREIDIYIYCMI